MKQKKNPIFKRFYNRLMVEGIFRSLLCGFVVGFAVNFVTSFSWWAFDVKHFWIPIVIGVGVGVIATVVFYFLLFKPDVKMIARRVDRLGLEERLITMNELEEDESYIALKQREDAKQKLSGVNIKSLKYKVSTAVVIACSVAFVMGSSMTVVAGLSESGVIKKGSEIMKDIIPDPPVETVELIYEIENDQGVKNEGGIIEGEPIQIIEKGTNGTTVIAVPDDGYAFIGWSDGGKNPTRTDIAVMQDTTVTARFMFLGDGDGEGDPGEGIPVDIEPPPDAKPSENDSPEQETDKSYEAAGGKWEETNMIIDGNKYYRDYYDEYYKTAMEKLAANPNISPELRAIIETYMKSLLI